MLQLLGVLLNLSLQTFQSRQYAAYVLSIHVYRVDHAAKNDCKPVCGNLGPCLL